MRFRRYPGHQYASPENVVRDAEAACRVKPLDLFTVCFLGHTLGQTKEPVFWVRRGLFGRDGDPARPIEGVREEFIDALTHDSVVVQTPYLTGRWRTELERLLAVFAQSQRAAENAHLLAFDTSGLPERFGGVARRLEKAAAEPGVLEEMDLEDEFLSGLEKKEREAMQVAERDRRLKELALRRAARARKR